MSQKPRKNYGKEFKESAVLEVIERGVPASQVARDLGVNENMLRKWKKQYEEQGPRSFPGNGRQNLSETEAELVQLRKELAQVTEERDILKKAVGIFSQRRR